ncbi:MAG: hypothetical protein IPO48_06330 [Saprospiraceae bacterium]|nr:hypothetical protein [Saprospiraceae bacterium]
MNKVGLILMLLTGMILASCSVNKKVGLSAHDLDIKLDHNAALNSGFTGLVLYDLDEAKRFTVEMQKNISSQHLMPKYSHFTPVCIRSKTLFQL